MSNKTVFVRTSKGEAEAGGQTALLFGEAKRVFMLVNNKSNVEELRKHAAPSLREIVEEVLEQLERDGFIRDKDETGQTKSPSSTSGGMAKIAMPKISVPEKPAKHEESETSMGDDLDFSSIAQSPSIAQPPRAQSPAQETKPPVQTPSSTPAETGFGDDLDFSSLAQSVSQGGGAEKPKEEAKSKKSAGPEIDFASILQAPGQGGGTDKAQAEAEAKKRAEAEARMRAEMEAKKRAEADAWARAELETKKKRAEAEAKARAEAEAKTRNEVEARIRAEMEARKRAEADAAVRARIEAEAKARAEAAAKARIEAEAAAKARLEAEARAKVEAATRARIEAEARAKAEAAARARIEAEAKARAEAEIRMRLEAEARARVEAENRMRIEAEARARAETEASRKAVEEIDFSSFLKTPTAGAGAENTMAEAEARARMEIEARMRAEEEAKVRARSEQEAKVRAEEEAKARLRAELEAGIRPAPGSGIDRLLAVDPRLITGQHNAARSMIATVLFFDVVGYTKQSVAKQIELKGQFNSLISGFIGHVDEDQRIILDTGDGAAIGFLQHPEDALDVAMKFRAAVTANGHRNYPELKVRAGIHLGPVNVMKDMNGLLNMVGDGINDAQRIMSFAGVDQIYVSRAYFDVISRLTADSARLFKYNGTQKDKHGREHQVYQVLGEGAAAPAYAMPQQTGGVESLLQDLSSMLKEASSEGQASSEWKPADSRAPQTKSPQELEAEAKRAAQLKVEQAAEAARAKAQQEAAARARAEQEEAARKLAADQAKAFAEAERRAQQQADAESKAQEERDPRLQARRPRSVKAPKPPRQRKPRRPLPLFKIVFTLIVLAAAGIVALPYVWPYIWPMEEIVAEVEKELSGQLKQPVHIGGLSTVSLPSPRMDLQDITVGKNKELSIRHIALHFNVLTLPASIREIEKAEVDDVTISASSFGGVLPWLQSMGANEHYPLAHVALHGVHISGDVPPLPPIGGTVDFDAYGKFTSASLSSSDGKITLKLQPHEKHFNLDLSISNTSLPLLPKIQFASLDATGEVGDGAIDFPGITGNMYGGSLKGSANLSWKGGWQLQGHMNVSSMLVEKALPGLKITGEMDGEAAFSMSADKLPQLASAPRLDGSLRVKDGAINSLDLAETARSGDRQLSPGTTHFDLLSGTLHTDNSGHHLKPLKISAGAMSMNGSADAAPDGRLTGQLLVDLNKVRAGMGTISLVLNGTVSDPAWSMGKR